MADTESTVIIHPRFGGVLLLLVMFTAASCDGDRSVDPDRLCEIMGLPGPGGYLIPPEVPSEQTLIDFKLKWEEAPKVAPPEIRSATREVRDSFEEVFDIYEAVGFDLVLIEAKDREAAFEILYDLRVVWDELLDWGTANCYPES